MRQSDRLATVLDELSADGSVSVSELSERFGVSVATVRRDLQLLEDELSGRLVRQDRDY